MGPIGMRYFSFTAILSLVLLSGCTGDAKPETPVETFKTYINAVKQKDTTKMKLLLSADSIKMHEQEAKAQNLTLDDVVKRETLFSEGQKVVEFRDETVEGERATLQVKNSFGAWESIPFVRENGEWKIDKKGYVDGLLKDVEQNNQQIDDFINEGKQPPQL